MGKKVQLRKRKRELSSKLVGLIHMERESLRKRVR